MLHASVFGQVADTTVVLPEIEVDADRLRATSPLASSREVTLDARAIEATGTRSVADLLQVRTGLFVQRYGNGGLATASLRGTGGDHTLVLVDGLRIADPQSGQVDLSLLPTALLSSVEVTHGTGGARYGSGALGGVVRLTTVQPDDVAGLRVVGGAGAFGERRAGLVASGRAGRFGGVVSAETSRAEGDFSYRNDALFPPRTVHRDGADRSASTVFARGVYRGEQVRTTAAAWYTHAELGLPGPANAPPADARQWDDQLRAWAATTAHVRHSRIEAKAMVRATTLRYAHAATRTDETSRTRAVDLEASVERVIGQHALARTGVSAGHDRADLNGGVEQTRAAAFLDLTAAFGRWMVYPAVRMDVYRSAGRTTVAAAPRLGVNLQPFSWRGLHVKAGTGRSFRMPTFNERFWHPGGNPDLKAEHGWSTDAGVHLQFGSTYRALDLEATVFDARLRDQIVWRPGYVDAGVQVWRPANLDRTYSRGLELSARGRARLTDRVVLDGGADYTFTDARDRSDPGARAYDRQLRYVPREQLTVYLGASWGVLRADVSGRLVGRRYVTSDESMALPAYRVVDVHLQVEQHLGPAKASLSLYVENLLDSHYSIMRWYPMPPRHAGVRLTLDLNP